MTNLAGKIWFFRYRELLIDVLPVRQLELNLNSVSQSYLTQLWTNDVFSKDRASSFQSLTDGISKYFTMVVISIAIIATATWLFLDTSKALNVFTAVLIIACPCAIALAAPFNNEGEKGIHGPRADALGAKTIQNVPSIYLHSLLNVFGMNSGHIMSTK